jgi:hypothetical protein
MVGLFMPHSEFPEVKFDVVAAFQGPLSYPNLCSSSRLHRDCDLDIISLLVCTEYVRSMYILCMYYGPDGAYGVLHQGRKSQYYIVHTSYKPIRGHSAMQGM